MFSAADGAELARWSGDSSAEQFGAALASPGDVDGDGFVDIAIGAPRFDPDGVPDGGAVRIYSGQDGALLVTREGLFRGGRLGSALAEVGDLDGDGVRDLCAGAPGVTLEHSSEGRVVALSGVDGCTLWDEFGGVARVRLGAVVAAAGDVDRDGIRDVLVAAVEGDFVRLFAGSDGAVLGEWSGPSGSEFGRGLAGIGDLNADGVPDLGISAPAADAGPNRLGVAHLISGASRLTLHRLRGEDAGGRFGASLGSLENLDGDGHSAVLAAAPTQDGAHADVGVVRLHAGNDLFLAAWPREPEVAEDVEFSVRERAPGDLALIALTAFDGAPMFHVIEIGEIDITGGFTIRRGVPTGLTGSEFSLRGYACSGPFAGTAESSTVVITPR